MSKQASKKVNEEMSPFERVCAQMGLQKQLLKYTNEKLIELAKEKHVKTSHLDGMHWNELKARCALIGLKTGQKSRDYLTRNYIMFKILTKTESEMMDRRKTS